jgi:hypothetical protein
MAKPISPNAAFRKKHGIAPKGKGPHAPSSYGLPVPPKDHPLAKPFARAVLSRSAQAIAGGRFEKAAVIKQVRKANTILYGKPNPSPAEKSKSRSKRRERDLSYYTAESTRSVREGTYLPYDIEDSWDDVSGDILKAAQRSTLFGGPTINYNDPGYNSTSDVPSDYDISIAVAYPTKNQVVIANGKTGEMWLVTFTLAEDGEGPDRVAFGTPAPATLTVVAKNQEAMRKLAESGRKGVRAYPLHIAFAIGESSKMNADGSVEVLALRTGDGNPADKNYYDDSFLESLGPLLDGTRSYRNHQSISQERDLPERDVDDLAGWFSDARIGEWTDPASPAAKPVKAAFATFHPAVGDAKVASLLRTACEMYQKFPTKPPFVAYSMNAYGVGAPGQNPAGEQRNIVSLCTELHSVDMVTTAGADGRPIFATTQESNRMKTAKQNQRRVALESGRRDADALVDIRTPEEKAADRATFIVESKRAIIIDLFKGPLGAKFREAAGVAPTVDPKKMSAEDVEDIAGKIGAVKGGAMHQMLADNLVEPDEDDPATGTSTEADPDDPPALTAESVAAMSADDAKKALLASLGTSATTTEANRVAARLTAVEKELKEAKAANSRRSFLDRFNSVCEQLKIGEAFRPLAQRSCSESDSDAELVTVLKSFKLANLPAIESAGDPGRSRELALAGAGGHELTFLRPGYK